MSNVHARYNPGIHGEDQLIAQFAIRTHHLDLIVESLRERSEGPGRHIIVVGPRGIGKTTLVRRVAAETRTNAELQQEWYAIVFSEEAYEIGTPGEFWLTALFHLSDYEQDVGLLRSYEELTHERDDTRLRERVLGVLMDFADDREKKLLIVVENLNMILGQQLSDDDGWVLRHTLQNEHRLMLLGTAPARFEDIEHVDKAWFEMVTIYELKPLTNDESARLWRSLTADNLPEARLRPITILTGGNPRLINILASFAVQTSFRQLMDNLIQLIDDHTEYFKGQLDSLPALERKVFVAVLDLWDPSSAKDVAAAARISVNKASSYLNRLVNRGIVSLASDGRKKMYKATERLYNIYYLMRKRGHPSDRVHAVVTFMIQFYEGEQIIHTVKRLAEEACKLEPDRRRDHFFAYQDIFRHLPESDRAKLLFATPKEFFDAPDAPEVLRDLASAESSVMFESPHSTIREAVKLVRLANDLISKNSLEKATEVVERAINLDGNNHLAWYAKGYIDELSDVALEAEKAYRSALRIKPDFAPANYRLAQVMGRAGNYSEAAKLLERVCQLEPSNTRALVNLARLSFRHLDKAAESEKYLRQALALNPESYEIWYLLGEVTHDQERYSDSREAFDEALRLNPESEEALVQLGHVLLSHLDDAAGGEKNFRRAIELAPNSSHVWGQFGKSLRDHSPRYREAEEAFRKSLELKPDDPWTLAELGDLLARRLAKETEGEQLLRKSVEGNPADTWAWTSLAALSERQNNYEEAELTLRRAIEFNPENEDLWRDLGHLMLRIERYGDAENAFLRLTELNNTLAGAWHHLGDINKTLGNYAKAEEFLKHALKIRPNSSVWVNLGSLYETIGREEEAEKAFKDASKQNVPESSEWRLRLIEFLLKHRKFEEALSHAKLLLERAGEDFTSYDQLATLFLHEAPSEYLSEAEIWARTAVEHVGDEMRWIAGHTLASTLVAQGKWNEALSVAPVFVDATASEPAAVKPTIDFFVTAAAGGYAERSLHLIESSSGAPALEPLIFGLRLFLGEPTQKAQEIAEIGEDIAKRIQDEAEA